MELGDDDLGVMHELVVYREVALDKADTPHLEAYFVGRHAREVPGIQEVHRSQGVVDMLGISCGIPVAADVGPPLARELAVDVVVDGVHHVIGSSEDGSLSTGVRVLEDMVGEDKAGGGVDISGAS